MLFEILYPPTAEEYSTFSEEEKFAIEPALLQHHKVTPPDVNNRVLVYEIKKSLQYFFGDYGSGRGTSMFQMKYFSNSTSTGILRCSKDDYEYVLMTLNMMKRIGSLENVIINVVKVSGTIKKLEEFAISRSDELMKAFHQDKKDFLQSMSSIPLDENDDI